MPFHPDVLNRFPNARDPAHTVHIMKYVFPRQFGLHNVFASVVDRRETAQPFKDYTMREEEIEKEAVKAEAAGRRRRHKLPRRLRRAPFDLVARWQRRHGRCAYTELLRYYCPANVRLLSRRALAGDVPLNSRDRTYQTPSGRNRSVWPSTPPARATFPRPTMPVPCAGPRASSSVRPRSTWLIRRKRTQRLGGRRMWLLQQRRHRFLASPPRLPPSRPFVERFYAVLCRTASGARTTFGTGTKSCS